MFEKYKKKKKKTGNKNIRVGFFRVRRVINYSEIHNVRMVSRHLCICIHTYTYESLHKSIMLFKKTNCFTTIAPLTLFQYTVILIHTKLGKKQENCTVYFMLK